MAAVLRRLSATGVFVAIFSLLAFLVLHVFPPVAALEIKRAAREFAVAWQAGRLRDLSYDPASAPDAVNGDAKAIDENTTWLVRDISAVDADRPVSVALVGEPRGEPDNSSTQTLAVTWNLGSGRQWTYNTDLVLRRTDGRLRVDWRPSTVHPFLKHGLILASHRLLAARAPITDADARVLPPSDSDQPAGELLGTVKIATTELAEIAPGRIVAKDPVGVAGLQQYYDERLAGQGGVEVDVVRDPNFVPLEPLIRQVFVSPPTPGKPVVLSIDSPLQSRAETALAGVGTPAALVAVDVASGAVLADANVGTDGEASTRAGRDKGLEGQYPPGAIFRLPTMLALVRNSGITPASAADCRGLNFQGQQFRNPTGAPSAAGIPFSVAFARNCVTGFANAARSLTGQQLQQAARSLGYAQPDAMGYPTYDGLVPLPRTSLELVQNAVGEGTVLASPLVVARSSATVASGIFHASTLVTQPPQPLPAPVPALSSTEQIMLAQLMQESVRTDPVLAPLRAVQSGEVSAIAGTAAYGPSSSAAQQAWCTGFQGSVAFAVLVTDSNGAAQAAEVARRFLS